MKKITLLLSFIACVVFAQAQTLYTDDFSSYAAGSALTGQNNWITVSGGTTNSINAIAPGTPAIAYPNYPTSGTGKEVSLTTSGQDIAHPFAAQTTGTIYYSVLVNLSGAQTPGDYFIHVGEPASTSIFFARTFAKYDGTNVFFGVQNASNAQGSTDPAGVPTYQTTSTYTTGTTYLLVVKFNIATTATSLIVNPSLTSEPTTGWITSTPSTAGGAGGTNVPTAAGIGEINLRQGTAANAPTLRLDGIRVATSYGALFTATGFFTPKAEALSISLAGKTLTVKEVADGSIVDIYSSIGAKVHSAQLVNGAVQLDNLSKGLYIVRVGNQSSKIMM